MVGFWECSAPLRSNYLGWHGEETVLNQVQLLGLLGNVEQLLEPPLEEGQNLDLLVPDSVPVQYTMHRHTCRNLEVFCSAVNELAAQALGEYGFGHFRRLNVA